MLLLAYQSIYADTHTHYRLATCALKNSTPHTGLQGLQEAVFTDQTHSAGPATGILTPYIGPVKLHLTTHSAKLAAVASPCEACRGIAQTGKSLLALGTQHSEGQGVFSRLPAPGCSPTACFRLGTGLDTGGLQSGLVRGPGWKTSAGGPRHNFYPKPKTIGRLRGPDPFRLSPVWPMSNPALFPLNECANHIPHPVPKYTKVKVPCTQDKHLVS